MILVFDNLLPNFNEYKKKVLQADFRDIVSQEQVYRDMTQDISGDEIYAALKSKIGFTPSDKINFLRAYRDDPSYRHPMWIHSDVLFADYIAIFMIQSSEFPQDDGVAFWRNKELGTLGLETKTHIGKDNETVDSQSLYPEYWELHQRVEFKENRIVVAPASSFHSKASYGNYGKTIDECRIVHVLFFNKEKPWITLKD